MVKTPKAIKNIIDDILNRYTLNDFIKLKDDKFIYINKTYTQLRYISKDRKFYVTTDEMRYTMVYVAKSDGSGKVEIVYDLYHEGRYSAYPIYGIESAIEKINKLGLKPEFKIGINKSHFKKESDFEKLIDM